MNMPTLREIFLKVREHLLKQGHRSEGGWGPGRTRCCFHGPKGDRCAVGVLIPECAYLPCLEHDQVGQLGFAGLADGLEKALLAGGVHIHEPGVKALLQRLQFVHDHVEPRSWAQAFEQTAVRLEHLLGRFEDYAYPELAVT